MMKLYIWREFLPGLSSSGIAFAVARSPGEARHVIRTAVLEESRGWAKDSQASYLARVERDLAAEPAVREVFPVGDYEPGES